MISKQFAKRRKDSAVSPVIATILMVAITVVLAAVLYVMVGGFTHNPGTANSAGLTETGTSTNNWTVTVSSVSASNINIAGLKFVMAGASGAVPSATINFPATLTAGTNTVTVAGLTVSFYIPTGNSLQYLQAGDYLSIGASGNTALSGATLTLYNGNSQLGSTTL